MRKLWPGLFVLTLVMLGVLVFQSGEMDIDESLAALSPDQALAASNPGIQRQDAGAIPAPIAPVEPLHLTSAQIESFRLSFSRHFIELGGREREYAHIETLQRRAVGSGQESSLDGAIRNYAGGLSLFPPQEGSRYSDLYPGADSAAVTWLNRQSVQLAAWLKQPSQTRALPTESMLSTPLAYPPDMWMQHFSGPSANRPDDATRMRIAHLRDSLVIEDALLAGDEFVMRPSIQSAMAEVFPGLAGVDLMTKFPELLPEWEQIERARRDLQWRYLRAMESEFAALR